MKKCCKEMFDCALQEVILIINGLKITDVNHLVKILEMAIKLNNCSHKEKMEK